jgi:hypothetical protein
MFKKPIHELTGVQRLAFEKLTGKSGESFEQLRRISQGLSGNYQVLLQTQKDGKTLTKEQQVAMVKAYGAFVDSNNKIVAATLNSKNEIVQSSKPITKYQEYLLSQGDEIKKAGKKAIPRQEKIALQQVRATNSVTKNLKTGVQFYLEKIYGIVLSAVQWITGKGMNKQEKMNKKQAVSQLENAQKLLNQQKTGLLGDIQKLEGRLKRTTDIKESKKLRAEIAKKKSALAATDKKMSTVRGLQEDVATQGGRGYVASKIMGGKKSKDFLREAMENKGLVKKQSWTSKSFNIHPLGKGDTTVQEALKRLLPTKQDREKKHAERMKAFKKIGKDVVSEQTKAKRKDIIQQYGLKGDIAQNFLRTGKMGKETALKAIKSKGGGEDHYKKLSGFVQGALKFPGQASNDFLLRMDRSGRVSVLNKFNPADGISVMGTKPGGGVAQAAAGSGGGGRGSGVVNIYPNGQNAYAEVMRALKVVGMVR